MKKIFSVILSICMLISLTAGMDFSAYAEELSSSGSCGENVTYTFDSETGLLTISGTGDMTEYTAVNQCPLSMNDNIVSVVIEEGVTSIGNQALSFCDNLMSVTIPSTVTKIGGATLGVNKNLTSIKINANNKVYDSRENCNAIIKTADNELVKGCNSTVIPKSITKISDCAFQGCKSLVSISIPEGITRIGEHAFAACVALTAIHIPSSVTEIGVGAFILGSVFGDGFNSAVSITVDENNPIYDSRNDCNAIIETATNTLLYGCNTTVIPFTVEKIANGAFGGCNTLKNISIPYSVKLIDSYAFDYTSLDSATIYNPECEIYDGEYTFFETKKIYGFEDSTAEQFANKRNIPFEAITCEHTESVDYKENVIPSTGSKKGSYDNVTYCSVCGKELGRETVETDILTTTLTIHWSSIDGVDLEEPVVFENVNPDLTVNEALEAAGHISNEGFFTKDGYVEFHLLLPKPMSEYKEVGPYTNIAKLIPISAETRHSKVGENGLDLYALIYKRISDGVIADVKAPVCGVSTKTDVQCNEQGENVYISQTNNPVVSTPEDAHYHIMGYDEMETLGVMWTTQSTINALNGFDNDPFEGTFEGGKNYFALIGITTDYGYIFPNEGPLLTVNGGTIVDTLGNRGAVVGIASVEAKHSPVTDKAVAPTFKREGKTSGAHCSGCKKILSAQKPVAKLGAASISKLLKGKKRFTVKWKKVRGVDGYQIQYSQKKNMKKAKKKTVKGAARKTLTVKKLKAKKTYYVRIRAYKKINGKYKYSKWSKIRRVKTR